MSSYHTVGFSDKLEQKLTHTQSAAEWLVEAVVRGVLAARRLRA